MAVFSVSIDYTGVDGKMKTPSYAFSPKPCSPAEVEEHLRRLLAFGYTHVEGFLPSKDVSQLLAEVEGLHAASKAVKYSGVPDRDNEDKIVYNLQNKSSLFIDLLTQDVVKDICKALLNDPYYRFLDDSRGNYILSYYNARSSGRELDLHIDSYIPAPGARTWAMQAAFVLEDMTLDNGCTVVCPGSHMSGSFSDRKLKERRPITASAGDLIIWDSRLWHGTLANQSGASRWVLIATFTSWWVKQTMDITRSLPDEIYQVLSPEQKVLMGFCSIPPADERTRINTKTGYESLLPSVKDYYRESQP